MIPLRGMVAFPALPISLELERDFSLAAAGAAGDSDRFVFLVCQKDISCDKPAIDDLYVTGTVARIRQSVNSSDGIMRVVAEGFCRGRLASVVSSEPYYIAEVMTRTLQITDFENDIRVEALKREVSTGLGVMLSYSQTLSADAAASVSSLPNPGFMADFVAANFFVRTEDKQEVLDEYDPLRRLERVAVLIESETKLLKLESDIHKRVREQIDENQKDYYLREQLKIIQGELGGGDDDIAEYSAKIEETELPDAVREKLLREVSHLTRTAYASPEASAIRSYIEAVLDFPWEVSSNDRLNLKVAERILDEDHYGLQKVKERILEYLSVRKLNSGLGSQIICLVGPPGVGKTSLGASIARAMNRKYARVSLGGVRDEADIRGHRRTYVASMPGRIVTALSDLGVNNPVMLLDEIDKLCSDTHGDPASAMLEILDPEQNKAFRDHFIELPVDLSNCFFIATANNLSTVPRPLLDRMEIIELNTYTRNEKLHIAKEHLISKQVRRHGLTKRQFKINDDAIFEVIDGYTREAGVRSLERRIAALCRKTAKMICDGEIKSVTVTRDKVKTFLGARRYLDERRDESDLVGVVNGLAYTEVGGDILKIECAAMEGTGKIELTGTLGDVMKESARIAVSYIRANAAALGVSADFYKKLDLHIHVPEGAVPKDGPSAGVTILTSLVSTLTGRAVHSDIAMTGELTLTGRVLAIGGLREKTTAAYSAGVKRVIIPYDNIGDLEEIDPDVRAALEFIPCKSATEVLNLAILPLPLSHNIAGVSQPYPLTEVIPDTHNTANAFFSEK